MCPNLIISNILETILVAFWYFSDQFGLCCYMAICGAVAYSPLPAEEEKVFIKQNVWYLLSFSSKLKLNFLLFLIDESTEPAVTQTPMGIDDKDSSKWFGLGMAVTVNSSPPPPPCFDLQSSDLLLHYEEGT